MLVGIFKNYGILVVICNMLSKGVKLYQDHFLADLCPFYTEAGWCQVRKIFYLAAATFMCNTLKDR